jgi:hypothetical protein
VASTARLLRTGGRLGCGQLIEKLKKGTYHFVCDPHFTIMHGLLKVT